MRIAMPLAALALAICVSVGHGGETDVADLPFDVLLTGALGGKRSVVSQLTLARDEISYRAMWAQLVDPGTAPGVDFDHWMVVAFFGSGPGGSCRHYRLTQVLARPDKVTLHISEEGVEACICISEPVDPYIIAKIPWTEKPIDFEIELLHDYCRS